MTASKPAFDALADIVAALARATVDHVVRVAVTGITASGKSTVADELARLVGARKVACVRVPVDGFHQPSAIRHRRGRDSAEGYYRDAYNYEALIENVLAPLGPGGNRRYVDRTFDLERDVPLELPPREAPSGSVVILDASFLLRPEVRDFFDYRIFVQTSFDIAEERGVRRDAAALGGIAEAQRLYRHRYHAAQRIYFEEAKPLSHAEALLVNDSADEPVLFLRHPSRAWNNAEA